MTQTVEGNLRTKDAILFLVRRYPRQSSIVAILLVLAGLVEGVGVLSLLPLLAVVTGEAPREVGSIGATILDLIKGVGLTPSVGTLLAVVVVGIALKALLIALAMRQVGYATAQLGEDLRLQLIDALMSARWSHFTEQPTGALANAMSNEATRASHVFLRVGNLIASLIQVLLYSALAFAVSAYVTLGALGFGAIMVLLLRSLVRMSRVAGEQQTSVMRSLVDKLTDGLNSIKPLKAMAREKDLQPILEAETKALNQAQRRQALSTAALLSVQEAFIVVILAIGVYFALEHFDLRFQTLLFMALLFQRTVNRIGEAQSHYQQLVDVESALWSIQASTARARTAREMEGGTEQPTLTRELRIDGVSFSYGPKTIFDDFSLAIPARSLATIIGPSGMGKTTLIDIITGLLSPDAGEIWVDDTALSTTDLRWWRSRIGYVPQEVVLLHDSVFVNVGLKDPSISIRDAEEALESAEALTFVQQLEGGMEASVGERGTKLSGGQRQRLAIARAIVRKPDLLILDEATASLDPATELSIATTLKKLAAGMTVIAVSHQPRLVDVADHVLDLSTRPGP